MKKNLINWMTFLMVAIMSIGLASCDDDDNKDDSNGIVGTWRLTYSDGYEQFILNHGGKGYYEGWGYENGRVQCFDRMPISYTYKEKQGSLVIVEDDGDVAEFTVVALTSSKLVLREVGASVSETYERQ